MPPAITATTGDWTHGGSVTISGTGFGTKSPGPGPVIWDDCNHTVDSYAAIVNEGGWSGEFDQGGGVGSTLYKTAPFNGVDPPHTLVNKYLVGWTGTAHVNNGGNTMVYKTRTAPTYPAYSYLSWWQRYDPQWTFHQGELDDDNLKHYAWSRGTGPYNAPYWYYSYNNGPSDTTATDHVLANADSIPGGTHYNPGTTPLYVNPFSAWVKVEVYVKISDDAGVGAMSYRENNAIKYENCSTCVAGPRIGATDVAGGTDRNDAIGGFQRSFGTNNYRYFTDMYVDHTWAHVAVGNGSTIGACTKLEVQKPTAWSATSITITVNRGVYGGNDTAWLYVYGPGFDGDGYPEVNTSGFAMTFGQAAPATPTNFRITS